MATYFTSETFITVKLVSFLIFDYIDFEALELLTLSSKLKPICWYRYVADAFVNSILLSSKPFATKFPLKDGKRLMNPTTFE